MTQPASIAWPTEDQSPQTCSHYWVIKSAAGPLSPGICQTCGEVREFENYVAGPTWRDDHLSKGYRAKGLERMAGLIHYDQEDDDGKEGS